ncbi:hypothetical protein [Nonomuraea basaltis]|uniref:hypothetical protein n=1 Tax=Nonomuraea basaltis TaxID=2495887 RepID=UPI00110C68A1|nr:hypothetical protein [Nonomuraea basaltis]TMR98946.1 hypothetical protein EJK15_10450 [Nonomuraea basaltis]
MKTASPYVTMAVVSFLGWAALAVESFVTPPPQAYRDALVLIPWTLYGVVLAGVHQAQRHRSGRLARTGLIVSLVGMLTSAVGNIGVLLGSEATVAISFPVGPGLFSLGLLLFGIATFRAGVLPRWAGAALVLSQPLAIGIGLALVWHVPVHPHGSYTGGLGHGLVVLLTGIALHRFRREPNPALR